MILRGVCVWLKDRYRMPEYTKLEYIKEIGFTHMRILEGVGTLIQLVGLAARLCGIYYQK